MVARTYRLRVVQRIRLLAFLTGLGALVNALGPRLIATEVESPAHVVGSEQGENVASDNVSVRIETCREMPSLEDRSA